MPSLWQMLCKKINPPSPKSKVVNNPLNAKIGSSIIFDVLDYRDMTFFVREICEVSRMVGGKDFPFVDYTLLARPLGKDDVKVRLRLMPATTVVKGDDLTHNTVLLQQFDEIPYNEDFKAILQDNEFVTQQDGVETGRFWRINDVKSSYNCSLKVVNEQNEKSDKGFVTEKVEYWDYWREFNDEAGQLTKEFLFIEMNKDNGFFTLWKGLEINARRIDIR